MHAVSNYTVNSSHPLCRVCGHPVEVFLDYGEIPLTNGLLRSDQLDDPLPRYRTHYGFCPQCFLVQLCEPPPPEAMFTEHPYLYITGANVPMRVHYAETAQLLRERWQPQRVCEIGPNDGTLLQHFKDLRHVGFEPARNVAQMATAKGCHVVPEFFGPDTAKITTDALGGRADMVVACHAATHVPDLRGLFSGIEEILSEDGVLVLEDPSLLVITQQTAFEQAYEEHAFIWSLPALSNVLRRYGLEIIDAESIWVHGGSTRITAGRHGIHKPSPRVLRRFKEELPLTHVATLRDFAVATWDKLGQLKQAIRNLQADGKTLASYGCTSKSTLTYNLLGLTDKDLLYISDSTPAKVGLFQPGTGIPVVSREQAQQNLPDTFLLAAWNYRAAILEKEQSRYSGLWLVWMPTVETFPT